MEKNSGNDRGAGSELLTPNLFNRNNGRGEERRVNESIMSSTKTFSLFRKIAFAEGVSFLVLLFIAMPLKYMADWPMAVTIVGGLHGLLFIAFVVMSWETKREYKKDWGWLLKSFIASIVPFGTFWMDNRQWKKEEKNVAQAGF